MMTEPVNKTAADEAPDPWLAGYEAAKKQAADALEKAAELGWPELAADRLRYARTIRGMLPKPKEDA